MKKIIFLVPFLIFSCEHGFKNKGQSTWVVEKVQYESQTTAVYFAITTDTTGLAEESFWFADSIGTFEVGDTLTLTKKRHLNENKLLLKNKR